MVNKSSVDNKILNSFSFLYAFMFFNSTVPSAKMYCLVGQGAPLVPVLERQTERSLCVQG